MKKLIISTKSTDKILLDFKKVVKKIKAGKSPKNTHYEIAFENKKDFNYFLRNINLLSVILNEKPESVYALAKFMEKDFSNIKKAISFFTEFGIIKIKKSKKNGRYIKKPIVDYSKIEFNLKVA